MCVGKGWLVLPLNNLYLEASLHIASRYLFLNLAVVSFILVALHLFAKRRDEKCKDENKRVNRSIFGPFYEKIKL